MKREILCKKCSDKFKSQSFDYPGEHRKFVDGVTITYCWCDFCNCDLPEGSAATACSIWADYGGIPYFPWENEYIKEVTNEQARP